MLTYTVDYNLFWLPFQRRWLQLEPKEYLNNCLLVLHLIEQLMSFRLNCRPMIHCQAVRLVFGSSSLKVNKNWTWVPFLERSGNLLRLRSCFKINIKRIEK